MKNIVDDIDILQNVLKDMHKLIYSNIIGMEKEDAFEHQIELLNKFIILEYILKTKFKI